MQQHLKDEAFEWIVADNASPDNLSSKLSPEVKYIRFDENYGFGKANNLAAQKATAPFLFFVNPDSEFTHDALHALLQTMNDATIGACGPRVRNSDGTIQLSFGPYLSLFNEAIQRFRMRFEKKSWMQNRLRRKTAQIFEPDYISGCALMVRPDVFQKIGGFDERYFLYEEDIDLCKRIREAGFRIVYQPAAEIIHVRNRSVSKEPQRVQLEYRKSQIHYYKKHRGGLEVVLLKLYLSLKFGFNSPMLRLIWS